MQKQNRLTINAAPRVAEMVAEWTVIGAAIGENARDNYGVALLTVVNGHLLDLMERGELPPNHAHDVAHVVKANALRTAKRLYLALAGGMGQGPDNKLTLSETDIERDYARDAECDGPPEGAVDPGDILKRLLDGRRVLDEDQDPGDMPRA